MRGEIDLAGRCAADRRRRGGRPPARCRRRRFRHGRSRSPAPRRRSARRAGRARARSGRRAIRRSRRSARRAAVARQHLVEQRDRVAGMAELQAAVVGDLDHALVPAVDAHHRLVHRQRVEELVGEDDGRAVRAPRSSVWCQCDRHVDAGQRLRAGAARSAGLISTRCTTSALRNAGTICAARSASSIMVPRPGPSSTRRTFSGEPISLPGRGGPQPDQLAEHLADLRRGDEVALGAERIARHVVAVLADGSRHSVMYCATGIGPAAAMRRRISASSGGMSSVIALTPVAAACRAAPPRSADAGEHQRQRQQHAHGEPAPQEAELRIGLAEEFAERAREPVAEAEGAEDQARPLAARRRASAARARRTARGLRAPPRRAGSDGAAAARAPGNTMAQGTSVVRPHSSALMKLAMRPRNSPIGADRAGEVAERQDRDAAAAREQRSPRSRSRGSRRGTTCRPSRAARSRAGARRNRPGL